LGARPRARDDLAEPVGARAHVRLPARAGAVLDRPRRLRRHRARQGDLHDARLDAHAHPLSEHQLHLLGSRSGTRTRRRRRAAARLQPRERASRRRTLAMNKQITRLAVAAIVLIASLIVATTYWQTWATAGLADRQDNALIRVAQFTIDRGKIYAADGRFLL